MKYDWKGSRKKSGLTKETDWSLCKGIHLQKNMTGKVSATTTKKERKKSGLTKEKGWFLSQQGFIYMEI